MVGTTPDDQFTNSNNAVSGRLSNQCVSQGAQSQLEPLWVMHTLQAQSLGARISILFTVSTIKQCQAWDLFTPLFVSMVS